VQGLERRQLDEHASAPLRKRLSYKIVKKKGRTDGGESTDGIGDPPVDERSSDPQTTMRQKGEKITKTHCTSERKKSLQALRKGFARNNERRNCEMFNKGGPVP